MEKKITAKRVKPGSVEALLPMVVYLKAYLPEVKPGTGASPLDKERYALALTCVKEMEKIIFEIETQLIGCPAGASHMPHGSRIM